MATKIRMKRMGRRKRPFFRIVVIDSRAARDGRYIEALGHYDPVAKPAEVKLDEAKVLDWLKKGAIPSDTVRNLLRRKGIILKWHLMRMGASEDTIHAEMQKFEVLQKEKVERVKPGKKSKKTQSSETDTPDQQKEAPAEKPVEQSAAEEPVEQSAAEESTD